MTKHPTDRRQRLAIKRRKYEEKQTPEGKAGKVRRIVEQLKRTESASEIREYFNKARETEDELRAAHCGVVY